MGDTLVTPHNELGNINYVQPQYGHTRSAAAGRAAAAAVWSGENLQTNIDR